tara:strand:- start:40 stop:840 length:801 start_codon:yes stop_codon:yes gene_type:complete
MQSLRKNMINDYLKLKDKFGIILGGSGLIGNEILNELLLQKSKILVLDINKPKIKNIKYDYEYFDCSNIENISSNLNTILKKYNSPNFFVNSSYPKNINWNKLDFHNIEIDYLKETINSNLISFVWVAKIIADRMKKQKRGSIVFLNSIYGIIGQNMNLYKGLRTKENLPYAVAKGGITNLTRQMASYYGQFNIRINSICPGGVKGKSKADLTNNNKFSKRYFENNPIKRFAKPSDIASLALFLCSNRSEYITGQNIAVDGGRSII